MNPASAGHVIELSGSDLIDHTKYPQNNYLLNADLLYSQSGKNNLVKHNISVLQYDSLTNTDMTKHEKLNSFNMGLSTLANTGDNNIIPYNDVGPEVHSLIYKNFKKTMVIMIKIMVLLLKLTPTFLWSQSVYNEQFYTGCNESGIYC